ncbi:760_t:CDS:2, partial [Entrophospora sp. SA101]
VIVLKVVDLDLKTICEEPGVHDLPITPLFASFCAPCVAEAVATDDKCNFFVLGKKIYNMFTSSSEDIEIPCIYDPSNPRFYAITEASKRSPIFSAAGELFAKVSEHRGEVRRCKVNNALLSSLSFASSSTSPLTSTSAATTNTIENNKRQVVVVDDNESHKKVCTELINRKGKGPELPCSNDEEEDLDLDH